MIYPASVKIADYSAQQCPLIPVNCALNHLHFDHFNVLCEQLSPLYSKLYSINSITSINSTESSSDLSDDADENEQATDPVGPCVNCGGVSAYRKPLQDSMINILKIENIRDVVDYINSHVTPAPYVEL